VISASPGGKAKTLVQIFAIGLYIIPLPPSLHWIAAGFMIAAVILTVVTGIDYLVRAAALVRSAKHTDSRSNPTAGPIAR
jgi:CDP-diacylglycerol--glycerol-3-phosphate 3-phosphatidyltransferase